MACGEHGVTSPSESRLEPQAPNRQVGGSSTFTIPVAPFSDDQVVPRMSTGIIVPKLATYVMRVSGVVTASPNTANPCGTDDLPTLTFGAGFDTDWLRPTIDRWTPSPTRWVSDTIPPGAEHEIFVSRGGYGAAVGCNAPDGSRIGGPLYVLSSSQTLTVDILKIGTFKLALTPQLTNLVPRDTTVVFIPGNDGDTQDDFTPDSWQWAPADSSPPVELFPNFCGSVCRQKLTMSGTMTLSGTVGGFLDGHRERVSASSKVIVQSPKITLTLSKDSVEAGDTVLVTATVLYAKKDSITKYTFTGKTPPGPVASRASAGSGTRKLTRPPVTSALRSAMSTGMQPCLGTVPAPTSCFIVASKSGTITVTAVADSQSISDNKPLVVKDCPLFADDKNKGDPLLKSPKVQQLLEQMANETNWQKPIKDQFEVGAWIMRAPNGDTVLVKFPSIAGIPKNQCVTTYDQADLDRYLSLGYTELADVHTHPNIPDGKMEDKDGVSCMIVVVDSTGAAKAVKRPYESPRYKSKDGVTHERGWLFPTTGPSTWDKEQWTHDKTHPYFPGLVVEPGQLWQISNDGTGIKVERYPLNDCVGHNQ